MVCISRSAGAAGEEVGRIVAESLGFRYVDEEIVARAAESGGVDPELVADAEERRSLLRRVLESFAHAGVAEVPLEQVPQTEAHRALIRDVVREVAEQGDAVIVAHAASHALAGRDGVLRVLVTAEPPDRVRRLVESGMEEKQAASLVRESDLARVDYLKRFYGVAEERPTHYDLVVNTETIPPEQAAELILQVARA